MNTEKLLFITAIGALGIAGGLDKLFDLNAIVEDAEKFADEAATDEALTEMIVEVMKKAFPEYMK
jgi:hypothetical protein